jgi:hypothetical protein
MYWILTRVYGVIGINPISSNRPNRFRLFQNYPNPFNPNSYIRFDIAHDTKVKLTIYDILGRQVTELVNEQMKPGEYKVLWNAANYASGVYFYKLEADNFMESKKMILTK